MVDTSLPVESARERSSYFRPIRLTTGMALVLATQLVLYASHYFQWFELNKQKGQTVLVTVAVTTILFLLLLVTIAISCLAKRSAQFSLAALMLMVPVAAIPFAWLAREIEQAQRQYRGVEALRKKGAGVMHSGLTYYGDTYFKDVFRDRVGGEWIHDFVTDVTAVNYLNSPLKENELAVLEAFPQLRSLDLEGTEVTDEGLKSLGLLTQLRSLNLEGTHITDAGLEYLQGNSDLHDLVLGETEITNAGLKRVASFSQMLSLDLSGTEITDTGLLNLAALTQLRQLSIVDTQVTAEGASKLKEALPKCQIIWKARRHPRLRPAH
jgi:hypothetical protein